MRIPVMVSPIIGSCHFGVPWRDGPCRWLDGIAMDGKTLRAAHRIGARDLHLLSACCQQHALVLGQQAVSDATGELGP